MKLAALFLLFLNLNAMAAPQVMLRCEDRVGGLDKFEIWSNGLDVWGVEYGYNSRKHYTSRFEVDRKAWELKEGIELPAWYGYARTLTQHNSREWVIDYQDECSGGSMEVTCVIP